MDCSGDLRTAQMTATRPRDTSARASSTDLIRRSRSTFSGRGSERGCARVAPPAPRCPRARAQSARCRGGARRVARTRRCPVRQRRRDRPARGSRRRGRCRSRASGSPRRLRSSRPTPGEIAEDDDEIGCDSFGLPVELLGLVDGRRHRIASVIGDRRDPACEIVTHGLVPSGGIVLRLAAGDVEEDARSSRPPPTPSCAASRRPTSRGDVHLLRLGERREQALYAAAHRRCESRRRAASRRGRTGTEYAPASLVRALEKFFAISPSTWRW